MDIKKLPRKPKGGRALNNLVFTDINDSPDNPRFGLGYHQLYDPSAKVGLIARLPDVTRVGDKITLYWDGANVQEYLLDQPTIDKGWLSFGVAPDRIHDPAGEVYYTLFDHDAGDLQTSGKRTVPVNRRIPGGLDPNIDTAINDDLLACTVSPNPVVSVAQPVTVTVAAWTYQEIGDELTVLWNNIRVPHPKLIALGAQTVTIPQDVLVAAGSSDNLLVNYEIRDIVDNYSLVSQPTYVSVEIDPDALTGPRVVEADRITLILDLEALGNEDAHVRIPSYPGNGQPYTVTLEWTGKTLEADIGLNLPPQRVDEPDFDLATFTIPNNRVKEIAGGSAVVRYTLVQEGDAGAAKKSKTTTITISGLPVALAAPVVDEANGLTVIELANITGPDVTVRIAAYGGQSAGDKISLIWKGTAADGTPVNYGADYTILVGGETQPITFSVPRENLDPLGSGKLDLSYQVIFNESGNTKNSPVTNYSVQAVTVLPVRGDEAFESRGLGALPVGVPVIFEGLIITITGALPTTSIIIPGIDQFGERALSCAPNHRLKFDFGGSITMFLISHATTATAGNTLAFFDADGRVQTHRLKTVVHQQPVLEIIELTSACLYCELTVDAIGTMVDNLVWS